MTKRLAGVIAIGGWLVGGCGGSLSDSKGPIANGAEPGYSGQNPSGNSPSPSPSVGVGVGGGGAGGGSLGITPGGAKDIGYARDAIKHGRVPEANTITVEGLLSEHDIPVEGGECKALLCARPALGGAP